MSMIFRKKKNSQSFLENEKCVNDRERLSQVSDAKHSFQEPT